MRKILLATTALVAFASAAQAAEAPIQVTAGGYVDFRAALFQESQKTNADRASGDFATEYGVELAADGKAANGIEYGAVVSLWNGLDLGEDAAAAGEVSLDQAYIWMSGDFGKVILGDEHGASDLFVMAPTVGEGQIAGSYTYFTDMTSLAQFQPTFVDPNENSTKITYYTPKVGNADHKVQLGVSYTPDFDATGNDVALHKADVASYRDVIEASVQYTGAVEDVDVVVSPFYAFANGRETRDATVYGVGAQATYAGVTVGGSFMNAGHWGTDKTRNERRRQAVYTVGASYEFDKVAVAANYMTGEGYFQLDDYDNANLSYVDSFQALGLGATYTWFPGMTTAADAVFFDQNVSDTTDASNNIGHVFMISQKMAF